MPWIALVLVAAALAGLGLAAGIAAGWIRFPPCAFKALTGLPCASCGLTRWGVALGRGDWHAAWHWHPAATLLALASPLAAAWDLRRAWRGHPYPVLPDSRLARGSFAALLLLTWLVQALRGI